jgi:hypothetical protein
MRELSCLGMAAASVFGRGVLSRALEAATTSMYMAAGRGGGGELSRYFGSAILVNWHEQLAWPGGGAGSAAAQWIVVAGNESR